MKVPEVGNNSTVFVFASLVLFFAFGFQLYYHAVHTSVTVDEPAHILAGYRHAQCGDFGINPEHPPLLKLLAAVPLQFRELKDPPWDCGSKLTSKFDSFSYGNTFLVDNGVDSVVVSTRLFAALMSMVLALLIFLAAWEMFGRWEAIIALAILAFEPNVIGHGSIITTDVAISTTVFATVYALYRFAKQPDAWRLAVAGLAFGLMLASKHSAVVFVPILFFLFLADAVIFRRDLSSITRILTRRAAAFVGVFVIGWVVLWAFYGFRYYAIPSATQDSVSIAAYIKENSNRLETATSFRARATELIGSTHAFPESYVVGMADVIAWGTRNTWIFDKNYPTGQWYYFPLAFLVKSNLALLLLLPLALLTPLFIKDRRRELMFMLVPAIIYFTIALTSTFTTGVRHILPVYPLLIIAAAAGGVWLCGRFHACRYILATLLVANATAAIMAAPNYLTFSNLFWGGYENTYRIFRDSNVDTGQGIKQVTEYIERERITDCWIVSFTHPELSSAIQPCRMMPTNLRILISRKPIDTVPPVAEGTFFVTVNDLPPRGADEYLPITQAEPVTIIGGNILVYRGRVEIPLVAALSHAHRSGAFLRMNRIDDAIAEGQRAVELGPDDTRTNLALGLALSRAGCLDEARIALERSAASGKEDSRLRNAEVRARQELERIGK